MGVEPCEEVDGTRRFHKELLRTLAPDDEQLALDVTGLRAGFVVVLRDKKKVELKITPTRRK